MKQNYIKNVPICDKMGKF